MSKLLSSVLDKVSEDNNTYRNELRNLNKIIDEKATALVGDIVTLSNYTIDFSSAISNAKEQLVNPISRIIESYVIKDLRSVETVNEQFIDKINYKLESANITTKEEKENFINSLDALLNDKYLEIVKIKRVEFLDSNNQNEEIENCVNEFIKYLTSNAKFDDDRLNQLIKDYKESLYEIIRKVLIKISNLYLNNFVNEIDDALKISLDVMPKEIDQEEFRPYVPELKVASVEPEVPEIPKVPEVPKVPEIPKIPEVPEVPNVDVSNVNVSEVPPITDIFNVTNNLDIPENSDLTMEEKIPEDKVEPLDVDKVEPIVISEDKYEKKSNEVKKPYDVEEILKIAKSPIVTMNNDKKEDFVSVSPIKDEVTSELSDSEFDEEEIVKEMISRLNNRLSIIKERQEKYDNEKKKIEDDEKFVNDLIETSNVKKEELDKFEKELDDKEEELARKKKELDKKINDVLPFANAIMKSENEEA